MRDPVVSPEGAPRWTSAPVTLHAVQCARCLKWRIIPDKEIYEAIREHILEKPWVCESAVKWRAESHCDLPADIHQDQSMLWAIDKPNLPSAPAGWERQITVRTDGSSKFADVYYTTPLGTKLRSKVEIEKYIAKHPDSVPPKTTMDQFSFAIPRPLPGICPQQAGGKVANPDSQADREEHEEQEQVASQGVDPTPQREDQGSVGLGDGNVQHLPQTTYMSPQTVEHTLLSCKRRNPDSTPPTRRTKQQIKNEKLGKNSPASSVTTEQKVL